MHQPHKFRAAALRSTLRASTTQARISSLASTKSLPTRRSKVTEATTSQSHRRTYNSLSLSLTALSDKKHILGALHFLPLRFLLVASVFYQMRHMCLLKDISRFCKAIIFFIFFYPILYGNEANIHRGALGWPN